MKKKNLWMICAAAAVMAAGSTVYAADFSDGEAPVISAEEPQLMDSAEIFDDGSLEEQEPVFGDTVSETELPAAEASASSVPLDEAHFPNKLFREYLSARDENKNNILDRTEIEKITSLNAKDIGTLYDSFSMDGYQYLTALEDLTLLIKGNDNSNQTITLDFSTLPSLKKLDVALYSMNLEDEVNKSTPAVLSLVSNRQLTDLSVSCDVRGLLLPTDCGITNYSVKCWSPSGEQEWFDHSHDSDKNQFLEPIAQMPHLDTLYISGFDNFTLSPVHNPELRIVDVYNGDPDFIQISATFDFTQNPNLEILRLRSVQLMQDKLDLSNCTKLQTIDFTDFTTQHNNHDSTVEDFAMIDLGNCHPQTARVVYEKLSLPVSKSGYIDFSNTPCWNPGRIREYGNDGFHFHDSKMFPSELGREQDLVSGSFKYYLNDARTILAEVPFTMTDIYNPEMITSLKVTEKTESSLTCKWNPAKRAHDRYVVYLQNSDTDETIKRVTLKSSATSTTFKGLKAGQRYKLVVRAYRTVNGVNYYSPHYDGNVICFTTPKSPTLKADLKSNRKVKFTWKKTPAAYRDGECQYVLYYRTSKDKHYQQLAKLADTKQQFTTKKLKKNTTYYFRMRSIIRDEDGNYMTKGKFTNTIKITVK